MKYIVAYGGEYEEFENKWELVNYIKKEKRSGSWHDRRVYAIDRQIEVDDIVGDDIEHIDCDIENKGSNWGDNLGGCCEISYRILDDDTIDVLDYPSNITSMAATEIVQGQLINTSVSKTQDEA